jgi:hypothetical protein
MHAAAMPTCSAILKHAAARAVMHAVICGGLSLQHCKP